MVITQGEVWWTDLGDPQTVVCVALTSNTRWADAPGNVLLTARS